MSGGAYDYECYRFEEQYTGRMHDAEMNELVKDLYAVLHDVEWWQSDDIGEDSYRKTLREFKKKWFKTDREERLKAIVHQECSKLEADLLKMLEVTE